MRVEWSTLMVFENFHRQTVIESTLCPDCGAYYGAVCGGARKPRTKSHLSRVQRFLLEKKVVLPEITKDQWLRYEVLRKKNREKLHERNEYRELRQLVQAIKAVQFF